MPPRSKVGELPAEVRAWLDRALADNQFGEYEALSVMLEERGFAISKSSLHRYGTKLERRLAAIKASTEAAAAIAAAAPDEADNRSNAIISIVQTEIFEALLAMQEAEESGDPGKRKKTDPGKRIAILGHAAKNIATLTRSSVNLKKHQADVYAKAQSAAAAAEKIAKKGGLSAEAVAEIRKQILGIAA
ncbi:DUF3486 domain-containing protein [Nitrosospira lacus]|uniref:Terminase n=1 Tax=Nitrosospira lacus TaxID=1288494 RepID=A0A1W6SQR0_9PROT|nr:DUF3486 family protein [Nitrosospira lacus]ARO88168.1 DUF3486 domain-containing protein [Nitrosospira lacus]